MTVRDETTDSKVPQEVRDEIKRICEQLNKEEEGESFKILVESFEVSSDNRA